MERTGVAVVAKDKGTCRGITLRDLAIHDVNGNVYDKHMNNGGIYMTALFPADEAATGPARFADVLVEGCYLYRVSRWGLAVGYTYAHAHFQGGGAGRSPVPQVRPRECDHPRQLRKAGRRRWHHRDVRPAPAGGA